MLAFFFFTYVSLTALEMGDVEEDEDVKEVQDGEKGEASTTETDKKVVKPAYRDQEKAPGDSEEESKSPGVALAPLNEGSDNSD